MQPAVAGVMVRSQIVKANGELVNVDYYASQRRQLADLRRLPRRRNQRSGDRRSSSLPS